MVGDGGDDRWGDRLVTMAIEAVKRVRTVVDGRVEVDVKRYARVEKIPGGELEDSKVCAVRYGFYGLLKGWALTTARKQDLHKVSVKRQDNHHDE